MTPDLHPEELLDKAALGQLTERELAILDAHLRECGVCRFARQASEDFRCLPAPQLEVDQLVTNALMARASRSLRPRARRTSALLAAAVALMAMGSFAAVGQWTGVLPRIIAAVSAPSVQVAPHSLSRRPPASPFEAPPAAGLELEVWPAPQPPPLVEAVLETPVATAAPTPRPRQRRRVSAPPPPAPEAFAAANQARVEGDRPLAMARYREVLAFWPRSPEAQQTRATLGRLLLDQGQAAAALEQLDAYLEGADGTLREEVLAARAQALARLGRVDDEARAWQTLVDHYPDSIHATRARARLGALAGPP